jgi:DNA ligase 1
MIQISATSTFQPSLISEKLDGVCAHWTGSEFITKNGRIIHAPAWWQGDLPQQAMTGEIYGGRGNLAAAVSAVRKKQPIDADWLPLTFQIFTAPSIEAERLVAHPFARFIPQHACSSEAHLASFLADVVAVGGEGVMQRIGSTLIKHKPFADSEGVVVSARQRSVTLRWQSVEFGLGVPQSLSVGQIITFTYAGLTPAGTPKCAGFKAVRDYE